MEIELVSITPDCETLIEQAGRTCYMSQRKTGVGSAARFIRMLVARGHLAVLEHAYATFRIRGISRVATHQMVRHRLCSFSQRSQRYVRESEGDCVVPPSIAAAPEARRVFDQARAAAIKAYRDLVGLGVPREDARFVMPAGTASEIVLSANLRELRHIVELRGAPDAQWEIRAIACEMLRLVKREAPNVFHDLVIGSDGCVERRRSTDGRRP